jgi:hypothetical protein
MLDGIEKPDRIDKLSIEAGVTFDNSFFDNYFDLVQ